MYAVQVNSKLWQFVGKKLVCFFQGLPAAGVGSQVLRWELGGSAERRLFSKSESGGVVGEVPCRSECWSRVSHPVIIFTCFSVIAASLPTRPIRFLAVHFQAH